MVAHPLRQGLALDELHRHVEVAARPGAAMRLDHVRAVDAPRDPLFHHEAVEAGVVLRQIDGRHLQHDAGAGVDLGGQVDVAARAGVQLALDAVAVELVARLQQRRQGQRGAQVVDLGRVVVGQARPRAAAARVRLSALPPASACATMARAAPSRSARMRTQQRDDAPGVHVLVDAVAGEHEDVAALQRARTGSRARGAAWKPSARLSRLSPPPTHTRWSVGQLFQRAPLHAIARACRRRGTRARCGP